MAKKTAKAIFKTVKDRKIKYGRKSEYVEDTHCIMVLRTIGGGGTVSTFCSEALVSDSTFYFWGQKFPLFHECYRLAYNMGKEKWRLEGLKGKDNDEFNFDYWKLIGLERYGLGRNPKIRMGVVADANPYEQYQQLCKLANEGTFTSSEFKQMMEAINVGIRAHESYKIQDEIEKMKKEIQLMGGLDGSNIVPIESATKAN